MSQNNYIQSLYSSTDLEKHEIDLVICYVLQINTAGLYILNQQIPEGKKNLIETYLQQRVAGKPLAYITGHKEFWSLDLIVNQHTLIPRPETELIVETVLNLTDVNFNGKILDLGTGTGAIALSIATERRKSKVTAIDFSNECVETAIQNQTRNNIQNVRCLQSDWFNNLQNEKFDFIVSNPPYIEENDPHLQDLKYEPISALTSGIDGLTDIEHIISESKLHLNPEGWLILEHGYNQYKQVAEILHQSGFDEIHTKNDLADIPRVTMGKFSNHIYITE